MTVLGEVFKEVLCFPQPEAGWSVLYRFSEVRLNFDHHVYGFSSSIHKKVVGGYSRSTPISTGTFLISPTYFVP